VNESITQLDHREPNPVEGLLPRPAVLSSTGWDSVHLERYHQPKFATAEHQHTLHAIAIGLPDASGVCASGYRWLDGKQTLERRQARDISIIPAGVAHRCSWDSEAQFMVLALEPELLIQVGQDWVNPDSIELLPRPMAVQDSLLQNIFTTLEAEAKTAGLGGQLLVDSLTTTLVVHLLRHYCATRPKLSTYTGGLSESTRSQIKDYIDTHLHRDLKLVELAALAQISPYYFARLFKQNEGITPHQYILKKRIERAQTLLRHSPASLAEISARTGFCDQSHMTRCFKRTLGKTPAQVRQG
jgi:AraC family transcriptional regulator